MAEELMAVGMSAAGMSEFGDTWLEQLHLHVEAEAERRAAIERELTRAHEELEQRTGELAVASEFAERMRRALPAAEARREQAVASVSQASEILTLLQQQVVELERRTLKFDAAVTVPPDRAGDLELSTAEARHDAARLRTYADTLKHEGDGREFVLERTTGVLENELGEVTDLRSNLSEARTKCDALERKLARSSERERELQRELDRTREALGLAQVKSDAASLSEHDPAAAPAGKEPEPASG